MKKTITMVSGILLVFIAVLGVLSCKGIPPPPIEVPTSPPQEPPAPPPPPPPAEPAAPELSVSISPRYFSPDNDGEADELSIAISCKDVSPIREWKMEIREPQPPYLLFSEWSGKGSPPASIKWNGSSSKGELVQSASDYPYTMTVTNIHGKSAVREGIIEVDVLVIREGNQLRVQVPSIVFGSNSSGFAGLDSDILARNDAILRRIALVLNKFSSYRINVEGHANLTAATESARKLEQEQELLPLSEQRARHVVDYLVRLNVNRSRLTPIGIGGARPVASYEDRDNWWKNRRVEFILIK